MEQISFNIARSAFFVVIKDATKIILSVSEIGGMSGRIVIHSQYTGYESATHNS